MFSNVYSCEDLCYLNNDNLFCFRYYYEDVLVGKVHKLYQNQIVPDRLKGIDVIQKRYKEINDFEKYLYANGTRVVKIFLNVSFSCLKIKVAISIEKNTFEPLAIVPLTPVVLARPI